MRVGFLGPEGTFSHAAALSVTAALSDRELVPLATIYDTVLAVGSGAVDLAVVPIENSIEGSVTVTLDTLAIETPDVRIVAETVEAIQQCLIAGAATPLEAITTVVSHPQASAQCAHFLHQHLPAAEVVTWSSTADAVRLAVERGAGWAALGPRLAAERFGGAVLAEGVEDRANNRTRFVTLARTQTDVSALTRHGGPQKTSFVFWGSGTGQPGWLVRCLSEVSDRGVNMNRIESRPLKQNLGEYMFFIDCDGGQDEASVSAALEAVASHVEAFRVLGSYPAA